MKNIFISLAMLFAFSTTAQAGDVFKNMPHNWRKGSQEIGRNINKAVSERRERRENFANNLTNAWHNAADNRQQRSENRADTINKAYHNTIDTIDNRRHNRADTINNALQHVGNHDGGHDSGHDGHHDEEYHDDYYHGYDDHWQGGGYYVATCTDVIVQPGYWTYDAWGNSVYINPRMERVCR